MDEQGEEAGGCNCNQPVQCPMEGQCMVSDIIYRAEVVKEGDQRGNGHVYTGMASGDFKRRFYNHKASFTDEQKEKNSELAKYVWLLKRKQKAFRVYFKTIKFTKTYQRETGHCQMCIQEKIEILKSLRELGSKCLNRRQEIFRNCIHKYKHLLGSINTRHKDETISHFKILDFSQYGQDNEVIAEGVTRSGKNYRDKAD